MRTHRLLVSVCLLSLIQMVPMVFSAPIDFTWVPSTPEIGEEVVFSITGVSGDIRAEWDFGGLGCEYFDRYFTCEPLYTDCHGSNFRYSYSGLKNVTVTVFVGDTLLGQKTHSLNVMNTGICGTEPGVCTNVILEPGFEGGSGSAWLEGSSNGHLLVTMNRPRSGLFSAWLGGIENEDSYVWQTPTLDPEAVSAILQYWYWIDSDDDTCGNDEGGVKVDGITAVNHQYNLCIGSNTSGYIQSDIVDLLPYAGTTPEIRFFVNTDSAGVSSLYIDDVVLEVCILGEPDLIFVDGFELGETTEWSITVP